MDTQDTGAEKALVRRPQYALEPARLSLVPTPPPPKPEAPPPPPPPPPPPRPAYVPPARSWSPPPRRRKSGVGRKVLWVVGSLVGLSILGHLVEPGSSSSSSGSGTCPSEVAQWLPSKATLVAQYQTDKHTVTLCEDSSGQVWYDGQVTGAAVSDSTHISLRASKTSNGYIADNKGYVYEINGTQLTATNNGKVVSHSQLKQVSP